jgi:A/G-specific adenine glycosylase
VLVSEFMLQQTSVARVLGRFEAFIDRFPTPSALADSELADALALWQGLGYPRRCRNLRDAAVAMRAEHSGAVPATLEGLLALPGVGPYTARAVLAFAHGIDAAPVDTNVARVLARLCGRSLTARAAQSIADELVPLGRAWEWNQIVMDLGAMVCTARAPRCEQCPVVSVCAWAGDRGVEDPATATAGTSRPQGRFEGSDRQMRGRAMRALGESALSGDELAAAMGLGEDPARAGRLIDDLVAERLVRRDGAVFRLG